MQLHLLKRWNWPPGGIRQARVERLNRGCILSQVVLLLLLLLLMLLMLMFEANGRHGGCRVHWTGWVIV